MKHYITNLGSAGDAGEDYSLSLDGNAVYIFIATKIGGNIDIAFGLVANHAGSTEKIILLHNDRPNELTFRIENSINFIVNVRNTKFWIELSLIKVY